MPMKIRLPALLGRYSCMTYLTQKLIKNQDAIPRREVTVPNTVTKKAMLRDYQMNHDRLVFRMENLIEFQV